MLGHPSNKKCLKSAILTHLCRFHDSANKTYSNSPNNIFQLSIVWCAWQGGEWPLKQITKIFMTGKKNALLAWWHSSPKSRSRDSNFCMWSDNHVHNTAVLYMYLQSTVKKQSKIWTLTVFLLHLTKEVWVWISSLIACHCCMCQYITLNICSRCDT